jgi:hypothetical protein
MSKKVAVLIKDKERQYEGLRTSLGLLLENHRVSMFVLNHEIELTEEYEDNLSFIEEMDGERLSDVKENIERHGFKPITIEALADRLSTFELVIPF